MPLSFTEKQHLPWTSPFANGQFTNVLGCFANISGQFVNISKVVSLTFWVISVPHLLVSICDCSLFYMFKNNLPWHTECKVVNVRTLHYKLDFQAITFSPRSHHYNHWEQPGTLGRAEILSWELSNDLRIDLYFFLETTNLHCDFSAD